MEFFQLSNTQKTHSSKLNSLGIIAGVKDSKVFFPPSLFFIAIEFGGVLRTPIQHAIALRFGCIHHAKDLGATRKSKHADPTSPYYLPGQASPGDSMTKDPLEGDNYAT